MTAKKEALAKKEVIKAIQSIQLRIDKQPDDFDTLENFVQVVDFQSLFSSNTHIIYGRNGTGKTHLLKAFYQYCENNFNQTKILPVYIDLKDMDLGPFISKIPMEELVYRFYKLFLLKIISRLTDFSNEHITFDFLEGLFGGENKKRKENIDNCLKNINSLLNMEQIEEKFKSYLRKIELSKEDTKKITGSAGLSGEVTPIKQTAQIKGSFGVSKDKSEKDKEIIELLYEGLSIINYETIRTEIEKLIDLCGIRYIILLIDEWSSISLTIQPLFAEMIRKTLSVSDKIFLKIVALKYFTKTSALVDPPHRIGFQSGVDFSQLADLDLLLNFDLNQQEVKDFFTIVLYKHISQVLPQLKNFSVKDFEEYLTNELFDGMSVYMELVRASEGNARDFLRIISSCFASLIQKDVGEIKKINNKNAINIAINHFRANKEPEMKNNPNANKLYDDIFKRVVENKQKIFLCSKEKAENNPLILELWHYRFIHLVSPSLTVLDDNGIPKEYIVYSIDYGKLLILKATEKGTKVFNCMISVADFLSNSSLFSEIGIFGSVLKEVLKHEPIGEGLKKITGDFWVGWEGVEPSNFTDIDYLTSKCVIDDIIN